MYLHAHNFRSAIGGIHMAVTAVQVAEVAQVDLQGLQTSKGFILRVYPLQPIFK